MRSTLFALGLFTVAAIHPALAQYAAPGTLTSPDRCPGGPMPGTLLRAAILQLPFPLPFRKRLAEDIAGSRGRQVEGYYRRAPRQAHT
jgi:hypothetical protein